MGLAICFKCGSVKPSALTACKNCEVVPRTNSEYAASIALSDHISSKEQLTQYSDELRHGKKLSVPRGALVRALNALKNPQFMEKLGVHPSVPEASRQTPTDLPLQQQAATSKNLQEEPNGKRNYYNIFKKIRPKLTELMELKIKKYPILLQDKTLLARADIQFMAIYETMEKTHTLEQIVEESFRRAFPPHGVPQSGQAKAGPLNQPTTPQQTPVPPRRPDKPRFAATVLHQSPFAVLGATTRDDRKRIVELAEEKSLELDHDVCQKARSDLTNPRTRLGAEISWLPGTSPRKASQLLESLLHDPMAMRKESGLPTLSRLNLLAAAFEAVNDKHDAADFVKFIQELAGLAENLSPEEVLRDINEDRAVSGFLEVRALDQIEAELMERKRYYRSAIHDALNRLATIKLIQVMTNVVDNVTAGGDNHAPELIDSLVDSYEVETHGILQKESENVVKLIEAVRDSANSGEDAISSYIDKLGTVARNWSRIARPIQLNAKARGTDHEASIYLAGKIRNLAIDLFNKHDMLAQSQRLTELIQELFSEVPEISDRIKEDTDTLANIFQQRKQATERQNEWAREITYSAEIGLIFKDTLSISPEGISWKEQRFALDSITRVRWGGIRQYVNFIPAGTDYIIAVGNEHSEAIVELQRKDIYTVFIDKLWRAVCVRLLGEMLEALASGHDLHFSDAILHDDSITLVKHKFRGANEKIRCSWNQVQVWNADGAFCIGAKDDKDINAGFSYINNANTHILEQVIRMAFKKPGMRRLSDLLR